ncbi:MFS transporter [Actinoplanes subtropicus]|uniref:MFS transporter n=1 Tax=Actinoplanes subtropicus TaxID=543632 RepID=UPI0006917F22|nr:MFS transporter [Actinoplanes subtropicus]
MALVFGAVTLVAMLAGIAGVARLNRAAPGARAERGHPGGLLVALRDRQFRALTASYLTVAITMNLVLAAKPYFARYELGHPEDTSLLVGAFMAPAVLTIPVWVRAARRRGERGQLHRRVDHREATGGAVGPYLFSACLAVGGFTASGAGGTVAQSAGALAAVRYGFTLVPATLMALAVLPQTRYTLDRGAHDEAMSR